MSEVILPFNGETKCVIATWRNVEALGGKGLLIVQSISTPDVGGGRWSFAMGRIYGFLMAAILPRGLYTWGSVVYFLPLFIHDLKNVISSVSSVTPGVQV